MWPLCLFGILSLELEPQRRRYYSGLKQTKKVYESPRKGNIKKNFFVLKNNKPMYAPNSTAGTLV